MNVRESNKLITEFMGVKPIMVSPDVYSLSDTPYFACTFHSPEECLNAYAKYSKYDSSWDWLMPVVEKIEHILPDDSLITIEYKDCRIPVLTEEDSFDIVCTASTKLEAVYDAAVEFIQWYNKKKES